MFGEVFFSFPPGVHVGGTLNLITSIPGLSIGPALLL